MNYSKVSWVRKFRNFTVERQIFEYFCLLLSFSPKAPLYNLTGHMDKILAVDWSVPSHMMSGGADNQLKIFEYQDVGQS